jgi:hypothetical protein
LPSLKFDCRKDANFSTEQFRGIGEGNHARMSPLMRVGYGTSLGGYIGMYFSKISVILFYRRTASLRPRCGLGCRVRNDDDVRVRRRRFPEIDGFGAAQTE